MKREEIIAVSGKPGLYKILGTAGAGIYAEHILDKTKIIAPLMHVSPLADIVVFTENEDMRLPEVFKKIRAAEDNGIDIPDKKASKETLTTFFRHIIPRYDVDKFYPSHMRKILGWYAVLKKAGLIGE